MHDSSLRGFALRIQPSGSKTWTLRRLQDGKPRRISIGNANVIGAALARARAHALLADGVPPPQSFAPSLRFDQFTMVYLQRRRAHWKPSTYETNLCYTRRKLLRAFGSLRLTAIDRPAVARWFYECSCTQPGGANRALAILKNMFSRARDWNLVPDNHVNPCRGILPNRRPPRGRLLNHDAIARLGAVLSALSDPDVADIVKLLLYTGCRLGEIMGLRWSEVKRRHLALTDSKSGPRTLPIGEPAAAILARRRRCRSSAYVFPHPRDRTRHRTSIHRAWAAIRQQAGLDDDIRVHDLRHTFASHAIMGGETMVVTGRLLGHRQIPTTARYAHLQDEFLLAAAERIAARIDRWWSPNRVEVGGSGAD